LTHGHLLLSSLQPVADVPSVSPRVGDSTQRPMLPRAPLAPTPALPPHGTPSSPVFTEGPARPRAPAALLSSVCSRWTLRELATATSQLSRPRPGQAAAIPTLRSSTSRWSRNGEHPQPGSASALGTSSRCSSPNSS